MESTEKKVVINIESSDEEGRDPFKTATDNPPTRAQMKEDPIVYRDYVRFLATTVPEAPPHLDTKEFKEWKHYYLLDATLKHLVAVFEEEEKAKDKAVKEKPKEKSKEKSKDKRKDKRKETANWRAKKETHSFYENWLVVNSTDYKDSPFYSLSSVNSLYAHLGEKRRECERMAAGEPGNGG